MASKKLNLTDLQDVRKRWKNIPPEVVPEDKRDLFERRKCAVDMYIDGSALKEIEDKTGIYASRISDLVKKCIGFDENGNFYGYAALLPGVKIKAKTDTISRDFKKLLKKYPDLSEFIEGNWFGNAKYTRKKNMSFTMLHELFLQECIELGVADFEYPFNTKQKAYNALRRYIKRLEKNHLVKGMQ